MRLPQAIGGKDPPITPWKSRKNKYEGQKTKKQKTTEEGKESSSVLAMTTWVVSQGGMATPGGCHAGNGEFAKRGKKTIGRL